MPAARKPKPSSTAGSVVTPTSPAATTLPPISTSARSSRKRNDTLSSDDPNFSPSQASSAPHESSWTEPPFCGFIESTEDALLILEAARRRMIPRVTRRLADRERKLIQSGSVFVFEEEESGIKRWTDGCLWSPSRILGNFLLYRETDKRASDPGSSNRKGSIPSSLLVNEASDLLDPHGQIDANGKGSRGMGSLSRPKNLPNGSGPLTTSDSAAAASTAGIPLDRARERVLLGSLTNSYKFKEDGMMKKTFSITLPNSNKTHHLVSYYKVSDVEAGRLRTPSSLPELQALDISPDFLEKTHFRVPPKLEVGEDGRVRYRGENRDEPDSPPPEPNYPLPPTSSMVKGRPQYDNSPSSYVLNGQNQPQYPMSSDAESSYTRSGSDTYLISTTHSSSPSAPWSPTSATNGSSWSNGNTNSYASPSMSNSTVYQSPVSVPPYSSLPNGSSYTNGYNYSSVTSQASSNPPPSPAYPPTAAFPPQPLASGYAPTITTSGYSYQQSGSSGYMSQPTSPTYVQATPSFTAAGFGNPYSSAYSQSTQYEIPPPSRPSTSVSLSNGMDRSSTSGSVSGNDDSYYNESSVEPSSVNVSSHSSGSSNPASTAHSASPDEFDRTMSEVDEPQRMMSASSGSPIMGYDNLSRRSSMAVSSPVAECQGMTLVRKPTLAAVISNVPIKVETDFENETQFAFSSRGVESPTVGRNGHGGGGYNADSMSVVSPTSVTSTTSNGWNTLPHDSSMGRSVYSGYEGVNAAYSSPPNPLYANTNGYPNQQIPPPATRYHGHSRNSSLSYSQQPAYFSPVEPTSGSMYPPSHPSQGYFTGYNTSSTQQPLGNGHHSMRNPMTSPVEAYPPATSSSSSGGSSGYHSSSGSASTNSSPYSDSHQSQPSMSGYALPMSMSRTSSAIMTTMPGEVMNQRVAPTMM